MSRFFKVYRIIQWLTLLAVILPFCIASVYNRPILDDVSHMWQLKLLPDATDPSFDFIRKPFELTMKWWNYGSGTFSTVFVYGFLWSVIGTRWANIFPVLAIITCVLACFQVTRCLRAFRPEISKDVSTCGALLLSIMFLLLLPDANNAIFWVCASFYSLFAYIVICLFSSLIRKCWANKPSGAKDWCYIAAVCLFCFFLGGNDSINSTISVAAYALLAIWVFVKRLPKRYLLPYLFLLAGYALDVLAPGNSVRTTLFGGFDLTIPPAIISSYFNAVQFLFSDVRCWLYLLLFLPIVVEVRGRFSISLRSALLTSAASVSLIAAGFFPILLTAGKRYLTDRHYDALFFYLCVFLVLNLIVWSSYLWQKRAAHQESALPCAPSSASKSLVAILATTVILLGFLSVPNIQFAPFRLNCNLAPVKVASHLKAGTLQEWASEYDGIVSQLRAHPGETIYIDSYPQNEILYTPFLTFDYETGIEYPFAQYYGNEKSVIRFTSERTE